MGSEADSTNSKNPPPAASLTLLLSTKCFPIKPSPPPPASSDSPENKGSDEMNGHGAASPCLSAKATAAAAIRKKPGGWKAMPYILGNETFERLATFGLLANFMVYLVRVYRMDQVMASNVINIWSGLTNFAPLVGAFISDSYAGRFRTIAFASFASFLGMLTMTLTAWLRHLHPPPCTALPQAMNSSHPLCAGPTGGQLGILFLGLGLLSVGTGGIRPCSIPFGVDQFDPATEEGARGITSFYNWYYMSFTVVLLITQTVVVYVQDSVSWVIGFGIPTILMLCSIVLFFFGTRIYVHVKPEGSVFTGIVQVFVAAHKKRRLRTPDINDSRSEVAKAAYYDPPVKDTALLTKLPLTDEFRCLNKAAMILENDLTAEGTPTSLWTLCSVQRVEEVKCIMRIGPIWASGIVSFTAMTQQGTFTISQALMMDRHLGPRFQIPSGSLVVISFLTIGLWLPFYDRVLVPALRKVTGHEGGITLLQRMGIGIVFSILSMVAAGLVERDRRASANSHPGLAPISVFWLAPQLILMGFCEAFNAIGQIEFFNRQFPDNMRSVANSLFFCSFAGASYLSSLVVTVVHRVTGKDGRPNWLASNLNAGRLDYFYYLLAGMGIVNFVYFLVVARRYQYKSTLQHNKPHFDVELSSGTNV
ncbi:protein NRT1/ PTR FAMILY 2.13-like [Rhodamnia argentea]|uniref:Protein NRT1/ PTR FAMILY 2.13-like n=1 Tax=Rhodamnia argentea TaxID=178133 RepID=A0A8B8MWL5_9MYRT|nr:protein NRT1/ PTR FAMILY 2.13-like [Rhodamnia argentea]